MDIAYPCREDLGRCLREAEDASLDFVVLTAEAFHRAGWNTLMEHLDECVRTLKDGGLLFLHGSHEYLPELGVRLDRRLSFRHWIVLESPVRHTGSGLPNTHVGMLLFVKGSELRIQKVRFPHSYCTACGRSLKDWGGKSHLMHPEGCVISDVWTKLPPCDNHAQISDPALDIILKMVDSSGSGKGIIFAGEDHSTTAVDAPAPRPAENTAVNEPADDLVDVIHCGDALDILKRYPDNSIDLAFADPPYNLRKAYNVCEDGWSDEQYISWCNEWLSEYVRLLKPTGSLYLLNLPRWAMHHAEFLNKHLRLRNWIVWDAHSEPRGKVMPAHYSLLFYTRHDTDFTFNYDEVEQPYSREYCRRPTCLHKRIKASDDRREMLTDIWWGIHRIRHRRDRDYHPCQLPNALIERIVRLSTNKGDIVLDAMCGAGTTPVVAARLGRRYVGIDIDESYVEITRCKIAEIEQNGQIARNRTTRHHKEYTKKELHLELRDLARKLGRMPTISDVREMSRYEPEAFLKAFSTWGRALRAARIEDAVRPDNRGGL